jgi:hypothetical protein
MTPNHVLQRILALELDRALAPVFRCFSHFRASYFALLLTVATAFAAVPQATRNVAAATEMLRSDGVKKRAG